MIERLVWAGAAFLLGTALTLCSIDTHTTYVYLSDPRVEIQRYMYDSLQHEKELYRLAWEHRAPDMEVARMVYNTSLSHGIDPRIAFPLVRVESYWRPRVVSRAGAIGLTQVMPQTGREFCGLTSRELYDSTLNADCGFGYLRYLLDTFNDTALALLAYNAGPHRARRPGYWNSYPDRVLGLAN